MLIVIIGDAGAPALALCTATGARPLRRGAPGARDPMRSRRAPPRALFLCACTRIWIR